MTTTQTIDEVCGDIQFNIKIKWAKVATCMTCKRTGFCHFFASYGVEYRCCQCYSHLCTNEDQAKAWHEYFVYKYCGSSGQGIVDDTIAQDLDDKHLAIKKLNDNKPIIKTTPCVDPNLYVRDN